MFEILSKFQHGSDYQQYEENQRNKVFHCTFRLVGADSTRFVLEYQDRQSDLPTRPTEVTMTLAHGIPRQSTVSIEEEECTKTNRQRLASGAAR